MRALRIQITIKKMRPNVCMGMRIVKLLRHHEITAVLDVGANVGQFAEELYAYGYQGSVLSFEPVSHAHRRLQRCAKGYNGWSVYKRCAIGADDTQIQIHISESSVFSSILRISQDHISAKPRSRVISSEVVPMYKLDTVISEYQSFQLDTTLLKIDTQGFEKEVLEGAGRILQKVKGIKIEIPLFPIYDGTSWTFEEIISFLHFHGFKPYSFETEGVDERTGRVNTIDGIFFRESAPMRKVDG